MNNRIIEIVTFKLTKDVNEEDFLKTIPASNDFIKSCDGFISRRLSCNDENIWLEHVEWESLEAAMAASKVFMKVDKLMPMMQAIDKESVTMSHNRLLISLG